MPKQDLRKTKILKSFLSKSLIFVWIKKNITTPTFKHLHYTRRYWQRKLKKIPSSADHLIANTVNTVTNNLNHISSKYNRIITSLNQKAETQKRLFNTQDTDISYSPFLVLQGAIVFVFTVALLSLPVWNTISNIKVVSPQQSFIKTAGIITTTSPVVAGSRVQYTVRVPKQSITATSHLLLLPKSAVNIQINPAPQTSPTTLTTSDRKHMAGMFPLDTSDIDIRNTQTAGLLEAKEFVFRFIKALNTYFLSDLEHAATQAIDNIKEKTNKKIKETDTAKTVDLSEEAEDIGPLEVGSLESSVLTGSNDIIQPSLDPDPYTLNPSDTVAVTYETQGPEITEQLTDKGKLVTVSDKNIVKVNCEEFKPAPEKEKNKDKEQDKEKTKDKEQEPSITDQPASLLTSVTNFFSSIKKFFFADLQEAVSVAIEAVVAPAPEVVAPEASAPEVPAEEPVSESAPSEEPEESTEPEAPAEEPVPPTVIPASLAESRRAEAGIQSEDANSEDQPNTLDSLLQGNDNAEVPAEVPTEEPAVAEEEEIGGSPTSSDLSAVDPLSGAEAETPAEEPVVTEAPALSQAEQQYQDCLASQAELTNILAYTTIPEIYKVGQEHLIKIKWTNENNEEVPFTAYDLNNNNKIDYIEWTVPHLSDQTFEIIFISKAWHLDQNQDIVADIYDTVADQEGTWQEGTFSTIPQGNYVRVTFEKILDNTKDITIRMRPNAENTGNPIIEVYPVYTDENGTQTQGEKIAEFPAIDHEGTYKIYLTELTVPTDVFDLKIIHSY